MRQNGGFGGAKMLGWGTTQQRELAIVYIMML
jgi:hypothetical protein